MRIFIRPVLRGIFWGLVLSLVILATHAGLMPFQMLFQPLDWTTR